MAKSTPLEVVVKVERAEIVKELVATAQQDAWEAGLRHALAWLGLKHYGDVMAKDNPFGKAEG